MVKIGRQKNRPGTLVSPAPVGWRTLAEKVYCIHNKGNLGEITRAFNRATAAIYHVLKRIHTSKPIHVDCKTLKYLEQDLFPEA